MKTFKLGIITDEVSQDLDEVIAFAEAYRLDTLEIRSIFDKPVHQLSDEELDRIRDRVTAAGMTVCALSTPIFKCDLNEEELAGQFRMAERCIEAAHRLGAKMLRGFSFWAKGDFEEHVPQIAEQLRRMAALLAESGLTLLLEFDPSVYASNARKSRRLIDAAGAPNLRALYDPGNDLWDPDQETPYPDGYEHLRGVIEHIHLKDAVTSAAEGPVGVAIGKGEVDYEGLFRRLAEDGYDGYLVVETHYRLTSKLTEEQLKRPSGSSFSVGGREASEECMESLLAMLKA